MGYLVHLSRGAVLVCFQIAARAQEFSRKAAKPQSEMGILWQKTFSTLAVLGDYGGSGQMQRSKANKVAQ
jgi:hypothetical protein